MNSETEAEIRREFHEALPFILDGTDPYLWPRQHGPGVLSCEDIIGAVSLVSGISKAQLRGNRRGWPVAPVRQVACYLIRELRPDLTYPQIGQAINRERTAVKHAENKIASLLGNNFYVQRVYQEAKRRLEA